MTLTVYKVGANLTVVDTFVASPPPPPPPPPPPQSPAIVSIQVNFSAVVCDTVQYFSSRYERYENHFLLTATAFSIAFQATNLAAGGDKNLSFQYPKYGLLVNGVERSTYTRNGTERAGAFVGALVDEPDGLTRFEIVAYDAAGIRVAVPVEGLLTHWGYIDRAGGAKNCLNTVAQNASRDWEVSASSKQPTQYQYAILPKAIANTRRLQPLAARLGTSFNTALPAAQLTKINYSVGTQGVSNTPCTTSRGITITENREVYFYSDLYLAYPRVPLLDGPRGFCTTNFCTDIKFGRNGKLYGADPWARWSLDATGTKKTLFGLRHKWAAYWAEQTLTSPEVEVVGNWDASIPATERFAWESWGMCWDERTLVIDIATAPGPNCTEHPHVGIGPVMFCSDRHGYILKAQFGGIVRDSPVTIMRFATAIDPWGMAGDGTTIYVAERGLNRISKFDMDTGAYLGALIEDTTAASLGAVDQSVRKWKGATPAVCRTHPIVAPEGVAIFGGYLYWGSLAQGEVRRIPLAGGPVEVVCRPIIDNNSNYVYIAVSDGSFGPAGTVFATSWTISNNGRPDTFVPGVGTASDGTPLTNAARWQWHGFSGGVGQGPGGKWESAGYGSAVAVGRKGSGQASDPDFGAVACTSSVGDVSVFMKANASDGPAPNYVSVNNGMIYYRQNFQVLHGPWCSGPDLPLPWGANPDCDYFMRSCGMSP
ncbi:MAG: hypothetical protein ACRENK_15660 [Gemmatimonadaceae bacterium]